MSYRSGPQGYGWYPSDDSTFRTDRRRGARKASPLAQLFGFLFFVAFMVGGFFVIAHLQHETAAQLIHDILS